MDEHFLIFTIRHNFFIVSYFNIGSGINCVEYSIRVIFIQKRMKRSLLKLVI